MKNKRFNRKQFTLIELIIVIVVIGILAGMALPKFMGVQRDAKVAAMFRDIDTLEKTIMIYYQDKDELPLYNLSENTFNTSQTLLDTLSRKGDDVSKLKVIDKTKLKDYLSKDTKYGNDKNENDEYLYSELTGNVYYSNGLRNGENIMYHTYENANGDPIYTDENGNILSQIKNVKFGNTLLQSNRTTLKEDPTNNLVGLVTKGKTLKIEINGSDLTSEIKKEESTINEIAKNSLFTVVDAASEEFEEFSLSTTLDKTKVNKVRMKIEEENKTVIFLIDFKGELEAPNVDVDTNKNPYELIVNYPEGMDISETQYIVDNKETTTIKPDLTPLMDGKIHTIDVRYKTTTNELSQWANVSFSYTNEVVKPSQPNDEIVVPSEYNWLNTITDGKYTMPTAKTNFVKNAKTNNYVLFNSGVEIKTGTKGIYFEEINSTGKKLSTKILEKADGVTLNQVISAKDGGYYMLGTIYRDNLNFGEKITPTEYVVVKYDNNGKVIWYNKYSTHLVNGIVETSDNGLAIVGSTDDETVSFAKTDVVSTLLIKVNSSGQQEFSKVIGGGQVSATNYSIIQTKDGGYLTTGRINSISGNSTNTTVGSPFNYKSSLVGAESLLITKYDASGNMSWHKFYGSKTTALSDLSPNVIEVSDGYIINTVIPDTTTSGDFGGSGSSSTHGYDALLLKINSIGTISWYNRYSSLGKTGTLYNHTLLNVTSNGTIITTDNINAYEFNQSNGSIVKKFGYAQSTTNDTKISNIFYDNGKYIAYGGYRLNDKFPDVIRYSSFIGDLKFNEFAK